MLLRLTCRSKYVVRKAAVVAVVVLDLHAVLGCKAFKSSLGIEGLRQGKIARHQIEKLETQVVVNKDGHIPVASLGECTLCLAIETWLGQLHVVDGVALPRLGGSKDGVAIVATCFGLPRNFCHGPKEAAGTARGTNRGESLWNLAVGCKPLELGERHVPEAVVLTHQLSLVIGCGDRALVLLLERSGGIKREGVATSDIRMFSEIGGRR